MRFLVASLAAGAALSASPPSDVVTIRADRAVVVYGRAVVLSGTVPPELASRPVEIAMQPHGAPFRRLATSPLAPDGSWRYAVRPGITSVFVARLGDAVSATVTVAVRPHVTLRARGGAFFARVLAGRSLEGRRLLLQRRTARGDWRTVTRVTISRRPRRFRARLRPGRSYVRVFLPAREAGPGYLPAWSRTIVVRR